MSIYETLQLIRVPVCMCAIVYMGHKVPERACGGELANLSAASNHHIWRDTRSMSSPKPTPPVLHPLVACLLLKAFNWRRSLALTHLVIPCQPCVTISLLAHSS